MITAPVASAATGRSKPQIYQGLCDLESAGVLQVLSTGKRNQSWEAGGLLDLLAKLEAGERLQAGTPEVRLAEPRRDCRRLQP